MTKLLNQWLNEDVVNVDQTEAAPNLPQSVGMDHWGHLQVSFSDVLPFMGLRSENDR